VKYAVMMYTDPAHTRAMSKGDLEVVARKHAALRDELIASGELLSGAGMVFPEDTTLLRLDGGGVTAERGPLARDAPIHVSAYYVFECDSEERAEELAGRVLDDHVAAVELRRIHDSVGL
jgi:hypothetical protein